MLVLTRAVNETIVIGDQIEITIIDIKGGKVRIGIQAPASVSVHRKELYQAIQESNREAARSGPPSLEALQKRVDEKQRRASGPGVPPAPAP